MRKISLLLTLMAISYWAMAQDIVIKKGWKLKIGDSVSWSATGYNDAGWQSANVSLPWEEQGFPHTDGFGWYRLHVRIPSSIKEKAFLKDSLHFDLGYLDDGGEIYLNGQLVYKNWKTGDIKNGTYGPGSFSLAVSNPAIQWDAENIIAVRLFDTGGIGGLYGERFRLHMVDLTDNVEISTEGDFSYGAAGSLTKSVKLIAAGKYSYSGTLNVKVSDPETGNAVVKKQIAAAFSYGKPFSYVLNTGPLAKKSYIITYKFTDKRSANAIKKSEGTPYILTPAISAKVKINGPDVFGERPGNPFLYKIPATGQQPITYKADGLPAGLKLDASTGIITGVVADKGDYPVTFTATNKSGSDHKKFTIKIGDLIGLTPALGWNSWNAFGLSVNDARVRVAAKQMADKLSAHGWTYINIDDGWEAPQRASDGTIVTNQKFPDMKGLTDYVHSLGLRMGIYSSPGPRTCGGYLGSYQHEDQDAQTYANWGIDYLKYDWCSYGEIAPASPSLDEYKKPYQVMRSSLDKVHRDILFSFCQYGMGDSWNWAAEVGGNSWRTTGDIEDTWASMSQIGFSQDKAAPHAQPGHFNDPDMLVVGKVGWGDSQHNSRLTPDEQYTHISLWALLSSPLLIGCDMGKLDRFTLNLLTNDGVLAISQDALGREARQVRKTDNIQIWVKELENGGKAIGIFNTSDQYQTESLDIKDELFNGHLKTFDVWTMHSIIPSAGKFNFKIPPHGVKLIRML